VSLRYRKWTESVRIDAKQNNIDAANKLSQQEQSDLIKSIGRMVVMRGSRQAPIARKDFNSNEHMKKHARGKVLTYVMAEASKLLSNTFGYE
jgi:hypothetical protein